MTSIVAFEALDERELDAWFEQQKAREGGGRAIRCAHCGQPVSTAGERIEQAGAHEHRYDNPAGIRYRIGCFRRAPGCRPVGEATLAWTWFPGHAWTVVVCIKCGSHLGWSYGAGGGGDGFFGLILDRLAEEM